MTATSSYRSNDRNGQRNNDLNTDQPTTNRPRSDNHRAKTKRSGTKSVRWYSVGWETMWVAAVINNYAKEEQTMGDEIPLKLGEQILLRS